MKNLKITADMLLEECHYLNPDDNPDLYDESSVSILKQQGKEIRDDLVDKTADNLHGVYFVTNSSLLANILEKYYEVVSKKENVPVSHLLSKNINGLKMTQTDIQGNGFDQDGFLFANSDDKHFLELKDLVPNKDKFLDFVNSHIGNQK